MKSTDLMLGDWVIIKDDRDPLYVAYGQINMLKAPDQVQVEGVDTPLNCIEPILITTPLLEKMGLKLLEVGDHGAATPPNMFNRFEKWELKTKWCTCILWKDRRHEVYHMADGNAYPIKYVHQLQHAINAINITDFIVKL